MKKKIIYFIMLLMFTIAGGCQNGKNGNILLEEAGREYQEEQESLETEENSAVKHLIYVQVSGAVEKPGVYELEEGSRIFQAVELAGGLTELADTKVLNQAETLNDGQMVYVPCIGEQESQAAEKEDGRINLNTATEAELMTLPGIGAARAKSILDWREKNGGFQQIEDLKNIEGIKDGVFSKIKDSVRVG